MLKKTLMGAGALFLLASAGVSHAAEISISGVVTASCSISSFNGTAEGTTATLDFSNFSDLTAQTVAFEAVCNAPHTVTLASLNQGIDSGEADVIGFAEKVDYTASVSNTTFELDTATETTDSEDITSAAVYGVGSVVTVTPTAPTEPLIAGTYTDALTLTIAVTI